jgi:hypothetical protein
MFCIEKHNKQVENTKHKNMTSIVLDRMLQYVSFHFEILFYTAAQFESGSLSLSLSLNIGHADLLAPSHVNARIQSILLLS